MAEGWDSPYFSGGGGHPPPYIKSPSIGSMSHANNDPFAPLFSPPAVMNLPNAQMMNSTSLPHISATAQRYHQHQHHNGHGHGHGHGHPPQKPMPKQAPKYSYGYSYNDDEELDKYPMYTMHNPSSPQSPSNYSHQSMQSMQSHHSLSYNSHHSHHAHAPYAKTSSRRPRSKSNHHKHTTTKRTRYRNSSSCSSSLDEEDEDYTSSYSDDDDDDEENDSYDSSKSDSSESYSSSASPEQHKYTAKSQKRSKSHKKRKKLSAPGKYRRSKSVKTQKHSQKHRKQTLSPRHGTPRKKTHSPSTSLPRSPSLDTAANNNRRKNMYKQANKHKKKSKKKAKFQKSKTNPFEVINEDEDSDTLKHIKTNGKQSKYFNHHSLKTPHFAITPPSPNNPNIVTVNNLDEAISKNDKSFWPYYKLISDISRCNAHQLLVSIDNVYGIDSLQTVLKTFLIDKLQNSLDLDVSNGNGLLHAPPKELMRDNENNIFERMRSNVPNLMTNDKQYQAKEQNSPIKPTKSVTSPSTEPQMFGNEISLEHIMKKEEIGYRVISYLNQKSFVCAHFVCRQFLYNCRLPRSRSHLMLRVGKVSEKMPVSVSQFLKTRINMLLHIELLHLVIDKPKWEVLKVLLSKLTELRQLDLMLPALSQNYIMPSKYMSKKKTLSHLKILRIFGQRKLKMSQQYPDISFLLKDFLKKLKMPKLSELWLMRVASKEKNVIKKFLSEYKGTIKSLEFELPVSMDLSCSLLKELYDFSKEIVAARTPLKSLSFRLIRDVIGLFTYQKSKIKQLEKEQNSPSQSQQQQQHHSNALSHTSSTALSLIGAMNLTNRLNAHNHDEANINDEDAYKQILDENEAKLRQITAKIVNALSDKVCFERLVFPGNVARIRWNAINRLQTLRNLHIIVSNNDMAKSLTDLCSHCGHSLTNLKLSLHGISNESDDDDKNEKNLMYDLHKSLKECTKLRHVRLMIGINDNIGRVSIDSFCKFMTQHSSTLSSVELNCYYLTFDFDKLRQDQSNKIGADSKFYIPNVKQELQEKLVNLFSICQHLKKIRIQHATSHRKFVAVQRLFHGKPHVVGVENLDHFVENQFL